MTLDTFRRYFTENAFIHKTRKLTGALLEYAVLMYLVMIEEKTPLVVKLSIVTTLSYLICTENLAGLAALIASLDRFITDEIREKAKLKVKLCGKAPP